MHFNSVSIKSVLNPRVWVMMEKIVFCHSKNATKLPENIYLFIDISFELQHHVKMIMVRYLCLPSYRISYPAELHILITFSTAVLYNLWFSSFWVHSTKLLWFLSSFFSHKGICLFVIIYIWKPQTVSILLCLCYILSTLYLQF